MTCCVVLLHLIVYSLKTTEKARKIEIAKSVLWYLKSVSVGVVVHHIHWFETTARSGL